MAMTDSISLASKFTGCLVGGLLGDCLGAPYEMNRGLSNIVDLGVSKTELQEYFDKLEGSYFECMYGMYFHLYSDNL
jgi:ADP-ribosylglycohydrolase